MTSATVKLTLLISSPDINETVSLEGEEFIFGRNSASTVHLNDPAFSRSHFKLVSDTSGVKLLDLGSSNGTFINSVQISPSNPEKVSKGDLITVNNSDIQIKIQNIEKEEYKNPLADDSYGMDHLSSEILKEANLRVEEILNVANKEARDIISKAHQTSDKIIADKEALADQYLEKQVIDRKIAIKKELENEKQKELDEIHRQMEIVTLKIESEHEKKRQDLELELKAEFEKIESKKGELIALEKVYELELEKKKAELETQIASQKIELAQLSASHEEENKKQIQLMEAQFENKKFKLKEELDLLESKLLAAKAEFSSLYENYNNQKQTQIKTLEGLVAQKEKASLEIKDLNEKLAEQKILNSKFAIDSKKSMADLQSEVEKIQKQKIDIESACQVSKNTLVELKKKISDSESEILLQDNLVKQKKELQLAAESEMKKAIAQKDEVNLQLAPLKQELTELIKKNEAASRQNTDLKNEHAKDVTALKASFLQMKKDLEEEMRRHKEAEEERLQNMTRHELNQINKIKEDSLRIVLDLEDSITKELSNATSKVFATTIGMTKFREIAPDFEKSIRSSLQAGVLKLLKNELTPTDPTKKKNLTSTQKTWKPMAVGMSISALIFGGIPMAYQYVQEQNDPVRKELEAQARAAAAPPIRKFEPVKVDKLGASLVDSVIYTNRFYEIISQEKFRSGLMKEGSVYMYKQWKIDEEKSIQSYSMILSLIDVLHEKSGKIDPDYEKRDIAKMKLLEKEAMQKLVKILGNEVRLEAAMKFQTRFYEDYLMNELTGSSVGSQ